MSLHRIILSSSGSAPHAKSGFRRVFQKSILLCLLATLALNGLAGCQAIALFIQRPGAPVVRPADCTSQPPSAGTPTGVSGTVEATPDAPDGLPPLATASGAVPVIPQPPIEPGPQTGPASSPTTPVDLPTGSPPAISYPDPSSFSLRLHPDGGLYVGDRVSIEVIAPPGASIEGMEIEAEFPTPEEPVTARSKFGPYGIGRRLEAVFYWPWDTHGLQPGEKTVTLRLLPDGPAWTERVHLAPASALPPPEPQARWGSVRGECCMVHYVTGTEAERDLEALIDALDAQAEDAAGRMNIVPEKPLEITLLPRLLGHGGFASDEISISYLDRNYISGDADIIAHHEMIHVLDSQLGGDYRPSALVEGLAVYQSGGHFHPEPLVERAAALLPPAPDCEPIQTSLSLALLDPRQGVIQPPGLQASYQPPVCGIGAYIPLETLFNNFYNQQHEAGYLEAGALIDFMVRTWGYPAFDRFYRHIQPPQNGQSVAQVTEDALQQNFGLGLADLEERFIAHLGAQPLTLVAAETLRLELQYYDTVRSYQQSLDPSAYFLTAWLLNGKEMRKQGIVADVLRRPAAPENLALELLLEAAGSALLQGDYLQARDLLQVVQDVLNLYPSQGIQAFTAHPLAAGSLEIVQAAISAGLAPQKLRLDGGDSAQLWVSGKLGELTHMQVMRQQGVWRLMP